MKYNAVNGLWPVEKLAELADGSTGSEEVARGGCLFAWNLQGPLYLHRQREGLEHTWRCRCISDSFLVYTI